MAEDQSINGDKWTEQASKLLQALEWEKVADSNIDIPGSGELKHGIDAMFKFIDGFNPDKEQGVFLEAKRYKTSSFHKSKLNDWVQKIDFKIRDIRRSHDFFTTYPAMKETQINNAILAVWFHDTENFRIYQTKFIEALKEVKNLGGRGITTVNRLFVITNDKILQLASLCDARNSLLRKDQFKYVNYFYPSSAGHGFPIQEIPVLNFEYMFSKIVFAKGQDSEGQNYDIVFYFGDIHIHSFKRVKEALLTFDMLNSSNNLIIFKYHRSDEFRKIEPDIQKLFSNKGPSNIKIKEMNQHTTLPDWIEQF